MAGTAGEHGMTQDQSLGIASYDCVGDAARRAKRTSSAGGSSSKSNTLLYVIVALAILLVLGALFFLSRRSRDRRAAVAAAPPPPSAPPTPAEPIVADVAPEALAVPAAVILEDRIEQPSEESVGLFAKAPGPLGTSVAPVEGEVSATFS